MEPTTIFLIVLAALAAMIIVIYNRLVALRQTRHNAFSDIDVQLRLRYDLVPRLVETVKGYMTHEREVLENVTAARTQVGKTEGNDSTERFKAESLLGGALGRLFAVAENYPDLKASANFQQLVSELSDIENKIAAARRFFNAATSEFNTSVQQFPANLIAGVFGFKTEPFYEIDPALAEAVREAPDVSFSSS